APLDARPAALPAAPASPLLAIDARLSLQLDEVIYNRQAVRGLGLELETRGGAVALRRLDAVLPGGLEIAARSTLSDGGGRPRVDGTFGFRGERLRETLAWLGADVSAVPAGKLQRIGMQGRLTSQNGNVEVRDAT